MSTRLALLTLSVSVFLCATASAQDRLAVPRLGIVLSPDGILSTLEGVPGAARLLQTSDSSHYDSLTTASHAQTSVLAIGRNITISTPERRSLLTLSAPPAATAISPQGAYLAIIGGADLVIYDVAAALSSDPHITPLITLSLDSTTLTLAISDHGTAIVSDATHLAVVRASGLPELVSVPITLPRFRPGTETAIAYSPGQSALILLDTHTLSTDRLLTTSEGLSEPTGLEIADSFVWISQQGDNSAISYSLDTRSTLPFHFTPGPIRSLGTPGVFLWGSTALLDTRRDIARVLLIATSDEAH